MEGRRKFIKKISIGTASFAVPKTPFWELKKPNYKKLHVKESNFSLTAISPSVIGFLYADFPFEVEEKINKIRTKNHYRSKLSFRSTDKYKFDFTKDLIDYFFDEPSLHFYARVVHEIYDLRRNNTNYVHDVIYRVNYKKAINDLKIATKNDVFYLDFITYIESKDSAVSAPQYNVPYNNFKTSRKHLVNYLNSNIPFVNLKIEPHKFNNLSQLSDFFTGNVYGDTIGIENQTKRKLLSYLKKKLNVKKLSDLYNSNQNKKFIISSNGK